VTGLPSSSVVVCTATHERAELLTACVRSLLAGTRVPDEIIVVVDQNPSLRAEFAAALPRDVRLLETSRPGLSEARNVGIGASSSDVVAFVDDDATAEPGWLEAILAEFDADGGTLGVGGAVVPRWGAARRWLCDELLWTVGCTYRGHREDRGPIRNPIGCNMAFRRDALNEVGGFASEFGKRGNALETCDETELALRVELKYGPGRIRYAPGARVRHLVPAERISWRLVLRRSLSEGLSKGRLHRMYRRPAVAAERAYARGLLFEAVPRMLLGGLRRRDAELFAGAAAVLFSLLVTGTAFAVGASGASGRGVGYGPAAISRWRATFDGGGRPGHRDRRCEAGDVTNSQPGDGPVRSASVH
jgi:glycosyltransferase involved in cell wall biosynthesis